MTATAVPAAAAVGGGGCDEAAAGGDGGDRGESNHDGYQASGPTDAHSMTDWFILRDRPSLTTADAAL